MFIAAVKLGGQGTEVPQNPALQLTELETVKVEVARLTAEVGVKNRFIGDLQTKYDELRLQVVMMEATPKREGFAFDWSTLKFRDLKAK